MTDRIRCIRCLKFRGEGEFTKSRGRPLARCNPCRAEVAKEQRLEERLMDKIDVQASILRGAVQTVRKAGLHVVNDAGKEVVPVSEAPAQPGSIMKSVLAGGQVRVGEREQARGGAATSFLEAFLS